MKYNGIDLELPGGPVSLSHSVALDILQQKSSTQNMDWTDKLGELPWGVLKNDYFESYANACSLFTLLKMDYQVCNGGIDQYFYNGYHEAREPHSEHDVELWDIDDQKRDFEELVKFAREVYPSRTDENNALAAAAAEFRKVYIEKDARVGETIECEEDEFIYDSETDEMVENPDYFEPYEDYHYEDVIHNAEYFDDVFYRANEYMEELLELRAQFICKNFTRELEKNAEQTPELLQQIKKILPASAFRHEAPQSKHPSLNDQIKSAAHKQAYSSCKEPKNPELTADFERK